MVLALTHNLLGLIFWQHLLLKRVVPQSNNGLDRGGGQTVSVLAFYVLSSNTAESTVFIL